MISIKPVVSLKEVSTKEADSPPIPESTGYDLAELDRDLIDTPFAGRIHYFESLPSTNSLAMLEGQRGAESGNVYLANEQSAGRGRGAHQWDSQASCGIYVSVLLRPQFAPAHVLWVSLAAALAAHSAALSTCGLAPDIRWPNDLLLGGKKLGGILTELNAEVSRIRHLVIGIGINVNQLSFPPELAGLATSLRIEKDAVQSRQCLVTALLQSLHREMDLLFAALEEATTKGALAKDFDLCRRFEQISSWVRGKQVAVSEAEEDYFGTTAGLDDRGFLRVQTSAGLQTVLSGSVREYGAPPFRETQNLTPLED